MSVDAIGVQDFRSIVTTPFVKGNLNPVTFIRFIGCGQFDIRLDKAHGCLSFTHSYWIFGAECWFSMIGLILMCGTGFPQSCGSNGCECNPFSRVVVEAARSAGSPIDRKRVREGTTDDRHARAMGHHEKLKIRRSSV